MKAITGGSETLRLMTNTAHGKTYYPPDDEVAPDFKELVVRMLAMMELDHNAEAQQAGHIAGLPCPTCDWMYDARLALGLEEFS